MEWRDARGLAEALTVHLQVGVWDAEISPECARHRVVVTGARQAQHVHEHKVLE